MAITWVILILRWCYWMSAKPQNIIFPIFWRQRNAESSHIWDARTIKCLVFFMYKNLLTVSCWFIFGQSDNWFIDEVLRLQLYDITLKWWTSLNQPVVCWTTKMKPYDISRQYGFSVNLLSTRRSVNFGHVFHNKTFHHCVLFSGGKASKVMLHVINNICCASWSGAQ